MQIQEFQLCIPEIKKSKKFLDVLWIFWLDKCLVYIKVSDPGTYDRPIYQHAYHKPIVVGGGGWFWRPLCYVKQ